MRKLTDYAAIAADEYLQETGKGELDALWVAEFFQDNGVRDDHPAQNLAGFYALVQEALTLRIEHAEKPGRPEQEHSTRAARRLKP